MTLLLAAIGILLLIVCPPAALVYALLLIALWAAVEIGNHKLRRSAGSPADLPARLHRLDIYPEDRRAPTITGPDHPLAAIGGVPRGER